MKLIDSDIIIGKALIYSGLENLSFEQVFLYLYTVECLLPEGYIVDGHGYGAIESFCINYKCLVNQINGKIVVRSTENMNLPSYQMLNFLKTTLSEEINGILKKATGVLKDSSLAIAENKTKNVNKSSFVLKKSNIS